MSERDIIVLGGGPGSGTTRLGRELAKNREALGVPSVEHFTTGDHVRAIGAGAISSAYVEYILDHLNGANPHGPLDDEIIHGIVREELEQQTTDGLLLLDGYPRRESQLDGLYDIAEKSGHVRGLITTSVTRHLAKERLLKRGENYPERQIHPNDADWRIRRYEHDFRPVIDHFERSDLPAFEIDTSGSKEATTQKGLATVRYMLGHIATAS